MRYKSHPGIYKLIIKGPSKTYVYVGQSTRINKRLVQHKCHLNKGNHYNKHLQRVYNKFQNLNIKVHYCNKEYLNILEQVYINVSKCSKLESLNFRRADPNQSGWKMSKETKLKISKALKGNPQKVNKALVVGKHHHNYINTEYTFINIFTKELFTGSRKDFMNKVGIHWSKCSNVTRLTQGMSKTCRGWALGNIVPKLSKKEFYKACKFRPLVFEKDEEVFVGTQSEFKLKYNIQGRLAVTRVLNGERKTTQGWKIRPLGE